METNIFDSKGNILSPEQVSFFKDSQVRDGKRNLEVVYHGTSEMFKERFFKLEINWFTTNKGYAKEFSTWKDKKSGFIYDCYLNAKNLFDCGLTDERIFEVSRPIEPFIFTERFKEIIKNLGINPSRMRRLIKDIIADDYKQESDSEKHNAEYRMRIHLLTREKRFKDLLVSLGYDGVTCIEKEDKVTYGIFNAEDIKLVDNLYPTKSKLMNEQLTEEETAKLKEEVKQIIAEERIWDYLPEYLYHATFDSTTDSIKQHGLGNLVDGEDVISPWDLDTPGTIGVFFDTDPGSAVSFVESSDDDRVGEEDIVVYRVSKKHLDRFSIYIDRNNSWNQELLDYGLADDVLDFFSSITYFYDGMIDYKDLEIERVE